MEGLFNGVWDIPVQLAGSHFHDQYAVGRIAVNFIFFVPVLSVSGIWWAWPAIERIGNAFVGIRIGALALALFVLERSPGRP